ncbi:MAG TPA: hypothetical protein DEA96_19415 [Leptospiraceae bacterium]|nr:hypothetical protein [Spirochaetaceae bacterium]HBS07151.1 hypothetical protein [Leptospiraceae bacterium]|tara:strand:- start:12615 stop:13589 length:975 start_codon:yes stop_codon:yes gene_type:complete
MEWEWTDVEHVVAPEEARIRLDLFLSRRFPVVNRSGWQDRIHEGHVQLNGEPARPGRRLHAGDVIRIEYRKKKEPDVLKNVEIIYRDSCLLVINKPPNLPVHPSGTYHKNTLQHILIEMLSSEGSDYRPRPVHRLDRETSGIMLLAESQNCARILSGMIRRNEMQKEYLVIVEGDFPGPEPVIAEGWIAADPQSEVRKMQRFWQDVNEERPPEAKHCRTEFYRVQMKHHLSLVRCILHTGRMHQIRATLHSMGFPVVGDRMYGVDPVQYLRFIHQEETPEQLKRLRMNRVALHSHILRLKHPESGEPLEFRCDLPADMQIIMNQ